MRRAMKTLRLRSWRRGAEHAQGDGHVLEDALVGQEPEVLEDDPHVAADEVDLVVGDAEDVPAADDHLALGRDDLPVEGLQQGRLARAARPGDEAELAFGDRERHVREGPGRLLILLPDVIELDHRIAKIIAETAGAAEDTGRRGAQRVKRYISQPKRTAPPTMIRNRNRP